MSFRNDEGVRKLYSPYIATMQVGKDFSLPFEMTTVKEKAQARVHLKYPALAGSGSTGRS